MMRFRVGEKFRHPFVGTLEVTKVEFRHDDGTLSDRAEFGFNDRRQVVTFKTDDGTVIVGEDSVSMFPMIDIVLP